MVVVNLCGSVLRDKTNMVIFAKSQLPAFAKYRLIMHFKRGIVIFSQRALKLTILNLFRFY